MENGHAADQAQVQEQQPVKGHAADQPSREKATQRIRNIDAKALGHTRPPTRGAEGGTCHEEGAPLIWWRTRTRTVRWIWRSRTQLPAEYEQTGQTHNKTPYEER